jgi:hypothetical protein
MNSGSSFKPLRVLRILVAALILFVSGAALIGGFIAARQGRAVEQERERSVKAPLRVSRANGAPVITLDAATQQRSGIETSALMGASYQEEARAYGMVLDLARLTDLSNSYVSAKTQLQTAQAKVAASKPAFERARKLYLDSQALSQAQFEAAEATLHGDEAAVAAAEARLRTLIATAHQDWGPVLSKSLTDGSPMVNRLIERQDFLLQITLLLGTPNLQPPISAVETAKDVRTAITYVCRNTRRPKNPRRQLFLHHHGGQRAPARNECAGISANRQNCGGRYRAGDCNRLVARPGVDISPGRCRDLHARHDFDGPAGAGRRLCRQG